MDGLTKAQGQMKDRMAMPKRFAYRVCDGGCIYLLDIPKKTLYNGGEAPDRMMVLFVVPGVVSET